MRTTVLLILLLISAPVDVFPQASPDSIINTYDLGGFLFAGDYPINNPESTGDTARAVLYRIEMDRVVPFDTLYFHDLGYYWFAFVPEGNYLVRTQLCAFTAHYENFAPTYFGDGIQWQSATVINLDHHIYDADIRLTAFTTPGAGPGSIRGTVRFGFFDLPAWPSPDLGIPVLLLDPQNAVLKVSYTDVEGSYRFDNLSLGRYRILAEQTGMYTQPIEIELDGENPQVTADLNLYENNVFGINSPEGENRKIRIHSVYPNPASNYLYVTFELMEKADIILSVNNSLGEQVEILNGHFEVGKNQAGIPTGRLAPGIYFLKITDETGIWTDYEKFIK